MIRFIEPGPSLGFPLETASASLGSRCWHARPLAATLQKGGIGDSDQGAAAPSDNEPEGDVIPLFDRVPAYGSALRIIAPVIWPCAALECIVVLALTMDKASGHQLTAKGPLERARCRHTVRPRVPLLLSSLDLCRLSLLPRLFVRRHRCLRDLLLSLELRLATLLF